MLQATVVKHTHELQEILALQEKNLKQYVDATEMQQQGFVTMHHTLEMLQQMHDLAPSIIIKDGDAIVAYALVMLNNSRKLVPLLEPMYANFELLSWRNKPLYDYRFYVIGQICIDKAYRGQGLFEQLYQAHRDIYGSAYDFIVTEVSLSNKRSLRAHERVGFKTINVYRDETDDWEVILWDWT
jgi:ribosomal protein S18 acetylase RimI-like enzyme